MNKATKRRGLGQVLDRAIAPFFPAWAAGRARARLAYTWRRFNAEFLSTYAGAVKDRTTNDWAAKTTSADSALIPDAATLNARARAMVRDQPLGRSGADAYKRHVVGTGITCRATAKQPRTGQELESYNAMADELWDSWVADPGAVDIEGRKTFLGFQRLGIKEFVTVGECLLVTSYVPRPDQVGLVLQALEPEQLDTTKWRAEGGNEIRGGVEIDTYGRAVAYHLHTTSHPGDSYRKAASTRVPADRVLHLMDPDRVRQTRGVTRFSAVLKTLYHSSMYKDFELIAKRMEACIGLAHTSGSGEAWPLGTRPPAGDDAVDARSNPEFQMEPGMIARLGPDETMALLNPQRPGANYGPYIKGLETEIGAGLGLDYSTLLKDYSVGVFSSQLQARLELWAETDPLQLLMTDLWLRPIRNEFITLAVTEGRLDAPGFYEDARMRAAYLSASWRGPAKRWIDPAKQAAAAKIALSLRLTTLRDICNEMNQDWREVLRQGKIEEEFAASLELDLVREVSKAAGQIEPRPRGEEPTGQSRPRHVVVGADGGNGDRLRTAAPDRGRIPVGRRV
ncbi:MAG TPA: phage portal protein [Phycisphaerae bacterium]|nr:phage portal protein [Phycisphaerae bacterium]